MATTLHFSTPPPPSSIHTPSTPRYGKDDNYEPYSPRRKSSRVSQRVQATTTPPRRGRSSPYSPNSSTKKVANTSIDSSPLTSPQTAPKKQTSRSTPTMGGRRISGALNDESAASAASALGLTRKGGKSQRSTTLTTGMLPTPAKTPKKQPDAKTTSSISSVARNIFPIRGETVEEVMPSPKKKGRKRYTGLTLDSFEAVEDGPIAIYTDSNDRVPEVDDSTDNPFYGESSTAVPEPTKRASKRRKVRMSDEDDDQTISEAEKREDGLIYVFRGKKIFRKFADQEVDDTGSFGQPAEGADAELAERRLDRPLTRSSMKPRLLFPTAQQVKAKQIQSEATEDDEEAITDIEDQDPLTPVDLADTMISTPKAPRFAPASPPTTARITRSKDLSTYSPFDDQPSEDERASSSTHRGSKKRVASPLAKARGTKRTRS